MIDIKGLWTTPPYKWPKRVDLLLDALFPLDEVCMGCSEAVAVEAPYLCGDCYRALEKPQFPCANCGQPRQGKDVMCGHCNPTSIPFSKVVLGFALNDLATKMVHRHKYGHERFMAHAFAALLCQRLAEEGVQPLKDFDAIATIPSGSKRLQQRGFDHIKDIAFEMAKCYNVPLLQPLLRVKHERAQAKLSKKERLSNMAKAFVANPKATIQPGMRILLIDDVLTTGATVEQAGAQLIQMGAKVIVATVFFTPLKEI